MWICPNCGEPNEAHFQACWKCLSDAHQEAALPKPESPPRELRSFGSVLVRALIAFLLGTLFGSAISHRHSASLAEAVLAGVVIGAVIGGGVGIIIWVAFPYQPRKSPEQWANVENSPKIRAGDEP